MTNDFAIRIITGDVLGTSKETQEAIAMAVKALSMPFAQPKQRWIPCSERLPEIGEDVLVTVRLSNMNMWLTGNSDNDVVYVCYLSTDADGLCWISNDYKMVFKKDEALAWMPLPKPYEEDKQ